MVLALPHCSKLDWNPPMFFDPPRTAAFWLIHGIPAAVLTVIMAALMAPLVWLVTALTGVIGASAWTAEQQRRWTDLPEPSRFIGT